MNEKVSRPVAIATAATPAVAAGSWPFAARRRLAALGWLLTLAAGLGAAVPVIAATVDAVRVGWVPAADQAIIATRAYDVFTSHMPLDGQYTTAWVVTGHLVRDLGPMLYWLVALPARFGSAASITVTMGAANTLAIIGCVALARRRGGLVLMFATAAAIAVMCRSLAAETFHDVWNASAGLFPCMLLIFLCWSLACGDHRLLPLSVLVASYVAQAHLMYVAPALGLLVVGLAGVAVSRRARVARWALAAVMVAAVCWTPTVVDEVTHHPGNLTRVLETATQRRATVGASVGWHAVVRAIGVPRPWWVYVPASRYDRKRDVRATPSSLRTSSCLALLAALVAVALGAMRRRHAALAVAALIGLVLCGALFAVAASTPTQRVMAATLGYTMWWGSQVGMWVWLILAWSVWQLLAAAARGPVRHVRARGDTATVAPVVASLLALAGTAAVAVTVASSEAPDEHAALYRPIATLMAGLDRRIPAARTIRLQGALDVSALPIKPALRYLLVRRMDRVLAPGAYRRLGSWYELDHRPYEYSIYVADRPRPPVSAAAVVSRAEYTDGWGHHIVTAWMEPARPAGLMGLASTPRLRSSVRRSADARQL